MKVQEFIKIFKPVLVKNMSYKTSVQFDSKLVNIETIDYINIIYSEAKEKTEVHFVEGNNITICNLDELVKEV